MLLFIVELFRLHLLTSCHIVISKIITYFTDSIDTFPNAQTLGNIQQNESGIFFDTNGFKSCSLKSFKILIEFQQLNGQQQTSEVTYKEKQTKGTLGKQSITLADIKVG